jgi:hypothetical protein
MQKTAESAIKRTEKGTFLINGTRTIKAIPSQEEENSWDIVDASTMIELDKQEIKNVNITGSDSKKVLQVKRLIAKGLTPTQIRKETGFSRSTVYRYKNLLSVMDTKKPAKNAHSTETLKSVFPILLICNDLAIYSTVVLLTLLLITLIYSIFKRKKEEFTNEHLLYNEGIIKLHKLIVEVCNYSFSQEAIICKSDKEAAYYRKVVAQYNNKSREIIVLPRDFGESNLEYFDRRERTKIRYSSNNSARIAEGEKNSNKYWELLKEKKYLSYMRLYPSLGSFLYYENKPISKKRLLSKLFLVSATDYLAKNPRPEYRDQAKKKFLIDELASVEISFKETQIIKEEEFKMKIPKIVKA